MKKKHLIILAALLLMFSLLSCSKPEISNKNGFIIEDPKDTDVEENNAISKKNVALVMKTLTNPFFVDMEKGARKAETELGINLIVRTGAQETSIEQQIAIVDELINAKVDAIVIAPGHSTDLIPVLKKAQGNGIKIVNLDNRLDPEVSSKMGLKEVPFVSIDNEQGAYLSAKYISDKIKKPTKVAILEGIRGANNSEQRKLGALRAFNENRNIDVVAVETANWKIDEGFMTTSRIFKKHRDIGAIFCANDMMALGAIEYLTKANEKRVLVAGFDALNEARDAVKQGKMEVTINQQADIQGYAGVTYAMKLIKGEKVPLETLIPVKVINKGSLEE